MRAVSLAAGLAIAGVMPCAAQSPDAAPAAPDSPPAPVTATPTPATPAAPTAPAARPKGTATTLPRITVVAAKPKPKPAPRRAVAAKRGPSIAARPPAGTTAAPGAGSPGRPSGATAAPNVLQQAPAGQPVTTVGRERFENAPIFSIADILQDSPGISIKQGNGPRDVGISIRGSNARNGFGIRNIVMFEDGFPVTQPDGLSRTDLTDPHSYGAVDVYRGPSSAMFGNYATGGAINFHLRPGAAINGFEYGLDVGGFGYFNNYLALGRAGVNFDYSLFASDVRGDGFITHSKYDTQTMNFLGVYQLTPDDRITVKSIYNHLDAQLPLRLSLNQFLLNPFQRGCGVFSPAAAAAGCGTINLFTNGFAGPTQTVTAEQAGLGRHDQRLIEGIRWEHDIDNFTTWRTQFVYDEKDINQPTGTTSAIGKVPAYNATTDVTQRGSLLGIDTTQFAGLFYNVERLSNYTYNLKPNGDATLGALTSFYDGGLHANYGARWREEFKFNDQWRAVVGADVERTDIKALVTNFNYALNGASTLVPFGIDRSFLNYARELGLAYRPSGEWQFRGRVAEGYGTPQISSLTTTPQGTVGNNTQLQSQENLGFDLGLDWNPVNELKFSATGFYEFFRNEIVTQSPGAGLSNFSFNAPASEHRGVELAVDWRPAPGWRLTGAYTYNNQIYTDYVEQLSAGAKTARFDRAGNYIPGVSPNELLARLGYDQPIGPWKGLGGFVQVQWKDAYFVDNANLLTAPAYELVDVNVHYDTQLTGDYFKAARVYFEVRNVFNKTYVASANNVSDSIDAATGLQNPGSVLAVNGTGSIFAGQPRTFYGGVKFTLQ
jgi:iron complex outermembrane recepter protein